MLPPPSTLFLLGANLRAIPEQRVAVLRTGLDEAAVDGLPQPQTRVVVDAEQNILRSALRGLVPGRADLAGEAVCLVVDAEVGSLVALLVGVGL